MIRQCVDYAALLRNAVPKIDVRAPAEYGRGAFDEAVNLPLLNDDERRQIGIRYRQAGQRSAIELGEALVSGTVREQRVAAWVEFANTHPDAVIYCWRGGLRSEIVQRWMSDAGAGLPRVTGGFRALRTFCLGVLQRFVSERRLLVLAGRTGSGKTALLRELSCTLDLEHLANHRGSAFGAHASPQPTPIHFENCLAAAMLRIADGRVVVVEDESRTIGRLAIPQALYDAMRTAPVVVLEAPVAERVERILAEYVLDPLAQGIPAATLAARYLDSLHRIRRRLGGLRHREVVGLVTCAFETHDASLHRRWIERLLRWYYDPMYDYQTEGKKQRIVFRGARDDVRSHIEQ